MKRLFTSLALAFLLLLAVVAPAFALPYPLAPQVFPYVRSSPSFNLYYQHQMPVTNYNSGYWSNGTFYAFNNGIGSFTYDNNGIWHTNYSNGQSIAWMQIDGVWYWH